MNKEILIGKQNTLKALRQTPNGIYLVAQNQDEVLLPNSYCADVVLDSLVDVFVYTDSEDRPVATTLIPQAYLGEYGYFRVVSYEKYGAFVDWGLPKDLFVPLGEQKEHFHVDSYYPLRVCLDSKTNRLYGTQKIGKWLIRPEGLSQNQEVFLFVLAKTPLGYKVIVNNAYEGMLFNDEVFAPICIGDQLHGKIKKIRSDGKLDCILVDGRGNQEELSQKILEVIESHGGKMECTTKSEPQLIWELFGMSKKNFKCSLNHLLSTSQVVLQDGLISKYQED